MAKKFSFVNLRGPAFIVSIVALVAMFVLTFVQGGFNLGVDFQPGISAQVQIAKSVSADIEKVRSALEGFSGLTVQAAGERGSQEFIVRVREFKDETNYTATVEGQLVQKLNQAFGAGTSSIVSINSVGPKYSSSLTQQAFWLVFLALIFISIYVAFRFRVGYAVGAMVATIHDTIFVIGFIGVSQMEVTSATIAAVLTIIGYSLNDTIVIFDRIRENEKTGADQSLGTIIDGSIHQTMSRTLMTSFTTLLAVMAIALFTTGEIQAFAIALFVGIVVGTYSSIFIASPVVLEWRAAETRRRRIKESKGQVTKTAIAGEASADVHTDDPSEVDADAIALEIRKQRTEKKKF